MCIIRDPEKLCKKDKKNPVSREWENKPNQREDYDRGHSVVHSPAGEHTERNRNATAALSAE